MKFGTRSGSVYEVDGNNIRRVNAEDHKRADGEWVELLAPPKAVPGYRTVLWLKSLSHLGADDYGNEDSDTGYTYRTTTEVEWVEL